jgi:hypothetical protein
VGQDKDAISTMALPELAAFPLDDFFDHYEKGLRKVSKNQLSNSKQLNLIVTSYFSPHVYFSFIWK